MSVQPAAPLPRRPARSRQSARRARIDPPNAFHANGFAREAARPEWIETADPSLVSLPVLPLAEPTPSAQKLSRKWLTAFIASVALHVAVAGFFVLRGTDESVQIAGSEEAGVVMMGNADADQIMEGTEAEATNVSIVTMTAATPVETVVASEVQPTERVESVTETSVAAVETEVVQEVRPVEQTVPTLTPPTVTETPPDAAVAAPSETVPPVLAVDTPEIVEDADAVNPVQPEAASIVEPTETVVEATAETVIEEAPEPPVKVVEKTPVSPAAKVAEAPKPAKPAPPKKLAEKKPEKPAKAADAPARKADKKAAAGSGGTNAGDARKGKADGQAEGTRADKAGKGKTSAAGNAAVTNYPGKVRARLSRAVGRISRSVRAGADRDVTVAFTVTASGGLGGARIARSSGSPTLDSAALAAVQRAAPFPPIPEGAGRSTWQFTVPLGITR